jgi:hypothetical protein
LPRRRALAGRGDLAPACSGIDLRERCQLALECAETRRHCLRRDGAIAVGHRGRQRVARGGETRVELGAAGVEDRQRLG